MYLIAGLGNPGRKFEHTRHNTGYMCVDEFAARHEIGFDKSVMKALMGECFVHGEKIIILKPQTYMNLSGECISEFVNYYKIEPHKLIVIYDDVDFPLGTVKIRKSGSAGTHNGMKNIIEHIKTTDFPRVRVGIGCEADIELYNYVLSAFSKDEAVLIEKSIKRVSDILDEIIQNGVDKAMNMFNGIK